MKKQIISLLLVILFLFSCGKTSEVSKDNNINLPTSETQKLEELGEQKEDITQELWYVERVQQRKKDLYAFYLQLEAMHISQRKDLPCDEYYPVDTEYFKSLYKEEQDLIKEYQWKCNDLKKSAK